MNKISIQKKIWQNCLIEDSYSIKEVIHNLSKTGLQIALVVKNSKLIGTITDGDIRRYLLKNSNLNRKVTKIISKRKPLYINNENITRSEAINFMENKSIFQLPILDKKKRVIGLILLNDLRFKQKEKNTFVIFAGGFGKRLLPFTKKIPKPMLKIKGKPILEHILLNAIHHGFQNFIILTHYLPNKIKEYFQNGKNWNVKIKYLHEKNPLGTAGGLFKLKNYKIEDPIIAINGDIISDLNFKEMLEYHEKNKADATMGVKTFNYQNPYGVVKTNGSKITGFSEKPIYKTNINSGVYVFSPKILKYISDKKYLDMSGLFRKLVEKNKKALAFPIYENIVDVGNKQEYLFLKKK